MNIITKIAEFCKSVGGIISFGVIIVSGVSSWLLIHNANVKTKFAIEYVKQNSSITINSVDSIVKNRTTPILNLIDQNAKKQQSQHYRDSIADLKDRNEMKVVKSNLTDYWRAKKEFETVINFQQNLLNAMDSLKKN